MKNYKGMAIIIGLFLMNNAVAVPTQFNDTAYKNFVDQYRDEVVTANNDVSMQWVQGAVSALRQGGAVVNLQDPEVLNYVATVLWRDMWEQGLKYYISSPEVTTRIWQSLTRSLDEIRRKDGQPRQLPAIPRQLPAIPTQSQVNVEKVGIENLRNFRLETFQIIANNPMYFYSAGSLQQSWLREALRLILANGQLKLTQRNKAQIQSEIINTAVELMQQILRNDPRNLSIQQKNNIMKMIRYQVEQFINAQPIA